MRRCVCVCVCVCVYSHRWDKVYRCVCWIWELWQLYNSYMKQLDLAELSLGNHTLFHKMTTYTVA